MKSTTAVRWLTVLVGSLLACQNAGQDRVIGISATGVVDGLVYLDRNGNRVLDNADTSLTNLPVRLITQGTRDTAGKGASNTSGSFRFSGLPVGSYVLEIDTTVALGDSLRVTRIENPVLTIRPDDTLDIRIAVGFPQLTVAQARAAPLGKKMFVVGVALNTRGIFGDTAVNLADTSAAIRLTALRTVTVAAGDSIRVFGTRSSRDGQPTLHQGTAFNLAFDAEIPFEVVSTAMAATADNGRLDAALIRVLDAVITARDTNTSPGQGNGARRLTVNDNSGPLEIRLDTLVGWRTPASIVADTVNAHIDVLGLLIPVSPGVWRLKPRGPSDIVHH